MANPISRDALHSGPETGTRREPGNQATVESLLETLRNKEAELARLRSERDKFLFFFDSSTSTNCVVDWLPGSAYSGKLDERAKARSVTLRPDDLLEAPPAAGPSQSSADGQKRTLALVLSEILNDPADDEFRIIAVNSSGRDDLDTILAFAQKMSGPLMTPGALATTTAEQKDNQKSLGFFDLAKAHSKPQLHSARDSLDGPVAKDNPLYQFLRSLRPELLEGLLLASLSTDVSSGSTLQNESQSSDTIRFTRPTAGTDTAPEMLLKCVSPPSPEVNGGFARFCLCNTASRTEYEATKQLKAALAAAEAANRAKTTFTAVISHELRTPLTAIIGFSRLLEEAEELTEEEHSWATTIRTAGDSLTNIVQDLLDVSKIEAGKMDVRFSAFRPAEFLSNVQALHHQKAVELSLNLKVVALRANPSVPGSIDVPEVVVSDELRLGQVLHNMIANAKKFTPAGGTITVTATAFTKQGFSGQRPFLSLSRSPSPSTKSHTLRFAVTDNGIGLSPETIPLLFKEFSPGDPSYARQFGGTGLGLFICKRIVELLGGRIGVDSAGLGQGCTFWVEIDYSPDDVYLMPTEEGPLSQIRKARRSSKTSKRSRDKLAKTPSEELLLMDQTLKAGSGSTSISSLASVTLTPKTDFTQFLAAGEAVDVVAGSSPGIPAVSLPAGLLGQRLPLQILVVEDNVVNCKLVLKLLSKEGYFKGEHIAIAENGTEAVELVLARRNSSPLDVILMDIQMPVMDGLEATRMIRQTLSPAEQPAIIALTANAMLEDREQCFGAGMDAHLSKPVRARDLYAALEKLGNVRRYALLGDSSSLSISEYSAGTSSFGTQGSPAAAMTLMEPPLMRPAKFSSSFDRE